MDKSRLRREEQKCYYAFLPGGASMPFDQKPVRKRGGQPGNQNARSHGYYARVVSEEDRENIRLADSVFGIDQEINLLRAKIASIAEHDPDNVRLIAQASVSLARLLRTQQKIMDPEVARRVKMEQARETVYETLAKPLGLTHAQYFDNPDL
jgi:hypothetical protein